MLVWIGPFASPRSSAAVTRNKMAGANNCSAMTVVFIPQVAEAIHQTINRTQQQVAVVAAMRELLAASGAWRLIQTLRAALARGAGPTRRADEQGLMNSGYLARRTPPTTATRSETYSYRPAARVRSA